VFPCRNFFKNFERGHANAPINLDYEECLFTDDFNIPILMNELTTIEGSDDSLYWQNELVYFTCAISESLDIERFGLKWERGYETERTTERGYLFCQRSGTDETFDFDIEGSVNISSTLAKGCIIVLTDVYTVSLQLNASDTGEIGQTTTFFCAAQLKNKTWIDSEKTTATLKGELFIDQSADSATY